MLSAPLITLNLLPTDSRYYFVCRIAYFRGYISLFPLFSAMIRTPCCTFPLTAVKTQLPIRPALFAGIVLCSFTYLFFHCVLATAFFIPRMPASAECGPIFTVFAPLIVVVFRRSPPARGCLTVKLSHTLPIIIHSSFLAFLHQRNAGLVSQFDWVGKFLKEGRGLESVDVLYIKRMTLQSRNSSG